MFRAIDEALAEAVDYVADDIEAAAKRVRQKGFVTAIADDLNESVGGAMEVVSEELGQVAKTVSEKGILQSIGDDLAGVTTQLFGSKPQRRRPKKNQAHKDDSDGSRDFISAQRDLARAAAASEASAKVGMKAMASPGEKWPMPVGPAPSFSAQPAAVAPEPFIDLMNQPLSPTVQAYRCDVETLLPTCAWPVSAVTDRGGDLFDPSANWLPVGSKPEVTPAAAKDVTPAAVKEAECLPSSKVTPAAAKEVLPQPISSAMTSSQQQRIGGTRVATPTGCVKLFDLMTKDAKQLGKSITASDILGEEMLQKPLQKPEAPKPTVEIVEMDPFAECRW